MPQVGFKPTILVLNRTKIFHAFDRAATLIVLSSISTEQIIYSEADSNSALQETFQVIWNPKFHRHVQRGSHWTVLWTWWSILFYFISTYSTDFFHTHILYIICRVCYKYICSICTDSWMSYAQWRNSYTLFCSLRYHFYSCVWVLLRPVW
jgi:hypothetical protein